MINLFFFQADEGEQIAADVEELKKEIEKHEKILDDELEKNQRKINDELEIINHRLRDAIDDAKKEAIKSGTCCVIS